MRIGATERLPDGRAIGACTDQIPIELIQLGLQMAQVFEVINGIVAKASAVVVVHHVEQQRPKLTNLFGLLMDDVLPVLVFLVAGCSSYGLMGRMRC